MTIENLKNKLPEYAKDIKLNLTAVLGDEESQGLNLKQIYGIALTSSYTIQHAEVTAALLSEAKKYLTDKEIEAAKSSSIIMAMNNVYYRFLHSISDKSFSTLPAKLRMNVFVNPGINKMDFELNCLAASALNGCAMCMDAHANELLNAGVSKVAVQSAVRIAAVINALSAGIEAGQ